MKSKERYKQPKSKEIFDLPELEFESTPFLKICCPSCDEEIQADHLNINDKIGKCGNCNVVFSFKDKISGFEPLSKKVKQDILQPEGIDLFYYRDELEISFKQPISPNEWSIAALAFQVPFLGLMLYLDKGFSFLTPIFTLIPFILSIFYLVRRYRQKSILTINDHNLSINFQPNIYRKNKSYSNQDIDQLYTKKSKSQQAWDVMLLADEGRGQEHIKLATVRSVSKAKFLEQEIERHLGIQDVEVPEEN